MRPGLAFIGLFALLIAVYALVSDALGNTLTFVLQAAIIAVVLAAALWFRQVRERNGWSLFQDDIPSSHQGDAEENAHEDPPVRKAS